MIDDGTIRINSRLSIPRGELELKATRSSGPGGQHVNTSSTRIELVWDVATSPSLTELQRNRLMTQLATRLDGDGRLRLVAQDERSQLRNRDAAISRLQELVSAALVIPKKRRPTKPTKASKEKRLEQKKQRGHLKRERRKTDD